MYGVIGIPVTELASAAQVSPSFCLLYAHRLIWYKYKYLWLCGARRVRSGGWGRGGGPSLQRQDVPGGLELKTVCLCAHPCPCTLPPPPSTPAIG